MSHPYNFRKAFYGKANRQMSSRINQQLRKDAGSFITRAYNAGKSKANSALSQYTTGSGAVYVHKSPARYATQRYVGKYTVGRDVRKASSYRRPQHPSPAIEMKDKGLMTICHSEYIGELISSGTTGSSNFVSQAYGINPGNAGTFPWLSGIAINFQDYHFKRLVFEYRPLISESTSTSSATLTSMGAVILSTQYDSTQGVYPNKAQMENSDFSVSSKPSANCLMVVECKSHMNPLGTLYISGQQNPTVGAVTGSDIRFQDLGIFQIASSNIPIAASTALDLGEIWVHYEVCLKKPQLNAGLTNLISAHYFGNTNSSYPGSNQPFGASVTTAVQPSAISGNVLQLTFTTNTFSFPLNVTEGNYLCSYYVKGTSATVAYATPTVANGTILTTWNGGNIASDDNSTLASAPVSGTTLTVAILMNFVIQVNAPGALVATVTFPATFTPPTLAQWDLFVTPYNLAML